MILNDGANQMPYATNMLVAIFVNCLSFLKEKKDIFSVLCILDKQNADKTFKSQIKNWKNFNEHIPFFTKNIK